MDYTAASQQGASRAVGFALLERSCRPSLFTFSARELKEA